MLDLCEHRRHVDAPVPRGVRRESSHRLRELPLASWPVASAGVVPRDRYVYEALQEVPFGVGRATPLVLQLLVRLEILSGPDQFEASFERHQLIIRVREGC